MFTNKHKESYSDSNTQKNECWKLKTIWGNVYSIKLIISTEIEIGDVKYRQLCFPNKIVVVTWKTFDHK